MKPDHTVYFGSREDGYLDVTVNGRTLDPAPSLRVWNHSPTGFEWGYGGSGPAQLALAICLDFLEGNAGLAVHVHQSFKFRIVANFAHQAWRIYGREVRETIQAILAEQPYVEPGDTPILGGNARLDEAGS